MDSCYLSTTNPPKVQDSFKTRKKKIAYILFHDSNVKFNPFSQPNIFPLVLFLHITL